MIKNQRDLESSYSTFQIVCLLFIVFVFVFGSVLHVRAPCFWELRRSFSVYWVIRIGLMIYEGTIISFVKLMRHVCGLLQLRNA
jgi:hypothetical protein